MKKKHRIKSRLDRATNTPLLEKAQKSLSFSLMIYAFINVLLSICFISGLMDSPMLFSIITPIYLMINVFLILVGLVFEKFKITTFADIISFIFASPIALVALYVLLALGYKK